MLIIKLLICMKIVTSYIDLYGIPRL